MKIFILILSMLMLFACNTRHKVKDMEKSKVQVEISNKVEKNNAVFQKEQENKLFLDSTITQQLLNSNIFNENYLQNFILKSNGNCVENSPIRFVTITDNKGNKTEIPVNDNTELIFNHKKKNENKQEDSKTESQQVTKEDIKQKSELKSQEKEIKNKKITTQNFSVKKNTEVKTSRLPIWLTFILLAVFLLTLTKKR